MSMVDLRTKVFGHGRPHVVILGAGTSLAALPKGDCLGKKVPLLDDLPDIVGDCWSELLDLAKPPKDNFEAQYSWMHEKGKFSNELDLVDKKIESFFNSLKLPDEPNIYDYLILSLRKKDVVATFNWDPFLMQAYSRNRGVIDLPDIRFLHGSVAYTSCPEHDILESVVTKY